MIYTGIGSRKTPKSIQFLMTMFALTFNEVLRSGHADGADMAFEIGATQQEIYLPWENFNGSDSELVAPTFENYNYAKEIAESIHPAWHACNDSTKHLHTRNVYQILGRDLDLPSEIVFCWTPDGANNRSVQVSRKTGGTGTAITLAKALDITVLNWYNVEDFKMSCSLLDLDLFKRYIADHSDLVTDETLLEALNILDAL